MMMKLLPRQKLPPFSKKRDGLGNSDLGACVFAQSTSLAERRSQQLLKRLNVRGGEADSSPSRRHLPGRLPFGSPIAVGKMDAINWQTAWERCSMPTTR
ncbi:hypothetical protein ACNKHV_00935 [Shigella flexneri]